MYGAISVIGKGYKNLVYRFEHPIRKVLVPGPPATTPALARAHQLYMYDMYVRGMYVYICKPWGLVLGGRQGGRVV